MKITPMTFSLGLDYANSSVPSLLRTSATVRRGMVQIGSTPLARQSKLFAWSARITPVTGNPEGNGTSKG